MKRNIDINEITDGKLYDKNSLVKIDCQDCSGCSECCHVTGDTIILDPYDIWQFAVSFNETFETLHKKGYIDLGVVDGLIQPHINIPNAERGCPFLNKEGMCSIHKSRPGFCRLFPLGRLYREDHTGFDYIIQIHECPHETKTEVSIKDWLGIPELDKYEKYIIDWHNLLMNMQRIVGTNQDMAQEVNMMMLNAFYVLPYTKEDFYSQFYSRIKGAPLPEVK